MKISIEYEISDDEEFCCKANIKICPNLKWRRGLCKIFSEKPQWDSDEIAFRKVPECIAAANKNLNQFYKGFDEH